MPTPLLRDDDVFLTEHPRTGHQLYDYDKFVRVHEMLGRRNHLVSIVASGIAHHPELVRYILDNANMDVALHGWNHSDYSQFTEDNAIASLQRGIRTIGLHFGRKPEWFFPPWNTTSDAMKRACVAVGLKLDNSGLTPQRWLAGERGPILMFHYWNDAETEALKECLDRDLL